MLFLDACVPTRSVIIEKRKSEIKTGPIIHINKDQSLKKNNGTSQEQASLCQLLDLLREETLELAALPLSLSW